MNALRVMVIGHGYLGNMIEEREEEMERRKALSIRCLQSLGV